MNILKSILPFSSGTTEIEHEVIRKEKETSNSLTSEETSLPSKKRALRDRTSLTNNKKKEDEEDGYVKNTFSGSDEEHGHDDVEEVDDIDTVYDNDECRRKGKNSSTKPISVSKSTEKVTGKAQNVMIDITDADRSIENDDEDNYDEDDDDDDCDDDNDEDYTVDGNAKSRHGSLQGKKSFKSPTRKKRTSQDNSKEKHDWEHKENSRKSSKKKATLKSNSNKKRKNNNGNYVNSVNNENDDDSDESGSGNKKSVNKKDKGNVSTTNNLPCTPQPKKRSTLETPATTRTLRRRAPVDYSKEIEFNYTDHTPIKRKSKSLANTPITKTSTSRVPASRKRTKKSVRKSSSIRSEPAKKNTSHDHDNCDDDDDDAHDDSDDREDDRDGEYAPDESESEEEAYNEQISDDDDNVVDDDDDSDFTEKPQKRRKTASKSRSKRRKMATKKTKPPKRTPKKTPKKVEKTCNPRVLCDKDTFAQARIKLHIASAPDALPCREDEFASVFSFVSDKVESHSSGSMYISGVPGTGKTETVHRVINALREDDEVPDFKYVEINAMKIADSSQAYGKFWEGISGEKMTNRHAADRLDRYFSNRGYGANEKTIVLLIDELDQLVTGRQSLMYQFLNWPTLPRSRLVILTIANTMDLPERMLTHKNSSRLGLQRLSFLPYTHTQLKTIISSRLDGLNVFKEGAIQLCAQMIASSSGDARTALDICRSAAELAERKSKNGEDVEQVGFNEIQEIINTTFKTPTIQTIHNSSLFERMFLYAAYFECRRSGIESSFFGTVKKRTINNCRMHDFSVPSSSMLALSCSKLANCRLLLTESNKEGVWMKIRLNVDTLDIEKAIQSDSDIKLAI